MGTSSSGYGKMSCENDGKRKVPGTNTKCSDDDITHDCKFGVSKLWNRW
jgi:hypothetical protein